MHSTRSIRYSKLASSFPPEFKSSTALNAGFPPAKFPTPRKNFRFTYITAPSAGTLNNTNTDKMVYPKCAKGKVLPGIEPGSPEESNHELYIVIDQNPK